MIQNKERKDWFNIALSIMLIISIIGLGLIIYNTGVKSYIGNTFKFVGGNIPQLYTTIIFTIISLIGLWAILTTHKKISYYPVGMSIILILFTVAFVFTFTNSLIPTQKHIAGTFENEIAPNISVVGTYDCHPTKHIDFINNSLMICDIETYFSNIGFNNISTTLQFPTYLHSFPDISESYLKDSIAYTIESQEIFSIYYSVTNTDKRLYSPLFEIEIEVSDKEILRQNNNLAKQQIISILFLVISGSAFAIVSAIRNLQELWYTAKEKDAQDKSYRKEDKEFIRIKLHGNKEENLLDSGQRPSEKPKKKEAKHKSSRREATPKTP